MGNHMRLPRLCLTCCLLLSDPTSPAHLMPASTVTACAGHKAMPNNIEVNEMGMSESWLEACAWITAIAQARSLLHRVRCARKLPDGKCHLRRSRSGVRLAMYRDERGGMPTR